MADKKKYTVKTAKMRIELFRFKTLSEAMKKQTQLWEEEKIATVIREDFDKK